MSDPKDQRDPVELLAAEFVERQRRNQHPTIDEYAARHPELADRIRDLFPTIVAMEDLKMRRVQSPSAGRVSLGAQKLEQLGDFRILAEIGRGGMGIVYEAEQLSLGRRVAVKVLPKQALLDAKQLQRFQREAQTAARLHHTNIVPVFGVGEQDGFHYFVMQHIQGVGLDKVLAELKRIGTAPETTVGGGGEGSVDAAMHRATQSAQTLVAGSYWHNVARIGLQVAGALQYAHAQGTLHRDIKPANLLLDCQHVVWVADFGLAKVMQQDSMSHTDDIIGTVRYMAPERFQGNTDARSDIYSLGLTLYELLTLDPAFDDSDRSSLIQQILHGTPPSPRKLVAKIPADLETVILKAIAREPRHRYQTAGDLADDLKCYLSDRPITARRTSSLRRAWRWCGRNRAVATLAATALGLLVLVAVVATTGYLRTREALDGEKIERRKADDTLQLATDVLDGIYEQFVPSRLVAATELTVEDTEDEEYQVPIQPVLSNEAAVLLESMLVFYDRLAAQGIDQTSFRRKAAEANRRVGDIRQRLGQFEQAESAYRRALEFYRALGDRSSDQANLQAEMARVHNELGSVYGRMGRRDAARQAHTKALDILRATTTLQAEPEVRYELARTHYYLGSRYYLLERRRRGPFRRGLPGRPPGHRAAGSAPPATEQLDRAIHLLEELAAEHPSFPDYRHLLARSYHTLSLHLFRRRDQQRAMDADKKATDLLEALVRDYPDVPDYRYDLSQAYAAHARADWLARASSNPTTEQRLRDALDLAENLVAEHPNVPDYALSLARNHTWLAELLERGGRIGDALDSYQEAVDLQLLLVERFPTIHPYVFAPVRSQENLARLLWQSGDEELAEKVLREAGKQRAKLPDRPGRPRRDRRGRSEASG